MSLTYEGIKAEKKAREILLNMGFQLQQLDWIGKKNNQYIVFEVKERELFNPPPFLGTGLDIRQLKLRTQILKDLKIRTYLLVFIKDSKDIYGQYLDVLEKGNKFDTKNRIRIYDIKSFNKLR